MRYITYYAEWYLIIFDLLKNIRDNLLKTVRKWHGLTEYLNFFNRQLLFLNLVYQRQI